MILNKNQAPDTLNLVCVAKCFVTKPVHGELLKGQFVVLEKKLKPGILVLTI